MSGQAPRPWRDAVAEYVRDHVREAKAGVEALATPVSVLESAGGAKEYSPE